MKQLNEYQVKWLAALRSGEYEQGKLALKQQYSPESKPKYCCLGVGADIIDSTKWQKSLTYWNWGGSYSSLGTKSAILLDITNISGELIGMNDFQWKSFTEIADFIENYWIAAGYEIKG